MFVCTTMLKYTLYWKYGDALATRIQATASTGRMQTHQYCNMNKLCIHVFLT